MLTLLSGSPVGQWPEVDSDGLLRAHARDSESEVAGVSRSSSEPNDTLGLLELGFKSFFKVNPRPFGQKNSGKKGFSDDNNGVQWNVRIEQDTGMAALGVNLEGMKYKDWPIARLLLREKSESKLPSLSNITEAEEIHVGLYRDAWQAIMVQRASQMNGWNFPSKLSMN